jgi:mono/diheme cytochrome c family protein
MVRPPLEPLAPDASRSRGHSLYAEHCAACHGADANGGDAGGILWDRPSLASRAEFGMLLEEGRGKMPGFKSVLVNRNDLDDLLAFLREKP